MEAVDPVRRAKDGMVRPRGALDEDTERDEDSEAEGIAEVHIAKHRNGGLSTVKLTFQGEYPRFMSYVGEEHY